MTDRGVLYSGLAKHSIPEPVPFKEILKGNLEKHF